MGRTLYFAALLFSLTLLGCVEHPSTLDNSQSFNLHGKSTQDYNSITITKLEINKALNTYLRGTSTCSSDYNQYSNAQRTHLSQLISSAKSNSSTNIRQLYNFGVNLNLHDKECWTSLMHAAVLNKADAVVTLLELGADINARNNKGETPLILAAISGNKGIVELLISKSANPHSIDHGGHTVFDRIQYIIFSNMSNADSNHYYEIKDLLDPLDIIKEQRKEVENALKNLLYKERKNPDLAEGLFKNNSSYPIVPVNLDANKKLPRYLIAYQTALKLPPDLSLSPDLVSKIREDYYGHANSFTRRAKNGWGPYQQYAGFYSINCGALLEDDRYPINRAFSGFVWGEGKYIMYQGYGYDFHTPIKFEVLEDRGSYIYTNVIKEVDYAERNKLIRKGTPSVEAIKTTTTMTPLKTTVRKLYVYNQLADEHVEVYIGSKAWSYGIQQLKCGPIEYPLPRSMVFKSEANLFESVTSVHIGEITN
ncbi:MAG: ankyrin repeat domain-containing protein [Candidatus Thiodiazotropha lotti]|uniref:Ankyrin repeat domain-containing protein n=1 Tax=Candidatus Thiodiazotropha lotti TaxID=2792787 RepID=A0A9E4K5H4_9GAMM|nr:ankyrin repeat domain-containing protein [Candidatus Thiodiazotropha lotti]MCW4203962.1 ankyrin repeat domain-containing protein [Candidatus Thiodiazotropha lotti]